MNPRLTVLAGLPETKIINLNLENGESFTIGRGVECDLPIGNAAVSRHHCRISRNEEGFRLEDLESHNGTFVNDMPVQSHLLGHGDRISFGSSYIMFLTREEDNLTELQAEFDDGSLVANPTFCLFPQLDTAEFSPDSNILVKLGKALNGFKETESLQRRILEIILEFIPSWRGAIVLADENLDVLQSVCVSLQNAFVKEPMQISRTVCSRVLKEQVALVSNDLSETNLSEAESLIASRVTALLCVPLKIGEDKGLIYLDSNNEDFRFTENHLEQMTALSFLAAAAIENAKSVEHLRQENALLKAELEIETNMIGESQPMREVFHLISKVAPSDSTVLISGESGTGKELIAKAVHQNSLRCNKPFVAINCAVLNENLLEAELFGYEKGAFTGAITQKKGKLDLAEGGTVFLDEIGELAPPLQAKLLRVLQEREFERVGGTQIIKANVRVIAATNRNLIEEGKKGEFRQDLYFRLNVVQLKIPPLRERKTDIPLLIQHFIKKYSEKCNRRVTGLSDKARKILVNYDWRGNVRELENVIERAIVLGSTDIVLPEDLPEEIAGSEISEQTEAADFHEQLKNAKQRIILDALEKSGGNYSEAARGLGIHPNNLHRLIRNLGMKNGEKN
jgi:Nif-specific regulatory protein